MRRKSENETKRRIKKNPMKKEKSEEDKKVRTPRSLKGRSGGAGKG